jgi:hypothetical protein
MKRLYIILKKFIKFIYTGKIKSECIDRFYCEVSEISQKTEEIKSIKIFSKVQLKETVET